MGAYNSDMKCYRAQSQRITNV